MYAGFHNHTAVAELLLAKEAEVEALRRGEDRSKKAPEPPAAVAEAPKPAENTRVCQECIIM